MRFSTDGLPARDRFALFRDGLVARFAALEMVRHDTIPFRGQFSLLRAGAVTAARLDTSPLRFLRSRELLRDGDDSICLAFCRRGRYQTLQNRKQQLLGPGDAVILDAGRLAAIEPIGPSNSRWSIKIPRVRLAAAVDSVDDLGGDKLPGGNSAQRLLLHYIEAAQRVGLPAGSPLIALFDDHVFDLVAYMLGVRGEARDVAEQRGVQYARRQAILNEIDLNFAEPGLGAAAVALRLGVTARYVHRLLEDTGKTFSETVLERRLARCMRLLTDPRRVHQRILEIALEAGFTDLSYFNRSFRRRFGETPSGARAGLPRSQRP